MAIKGGVILFVGSADAARDHIGPDTEVLDVDGATVLPGLVDSHTHVAGLGELQARVNLIGVETEEEAVALVAKRAASTPAGEWILGRGWDEGAWANRYPTMELLSERIPDHPVVLDSLHGFAVWGNRLAFEKAGITRDTESPEGGEILRDADGSPTGVVLNRAGHPPRQAPAAARGLVHPEQNMTPEEAVRGYTVWSAYAAHWEGQTGVLAPGRWADLTVMDIDPLRLGETDPGAILDGEIVATIVAGGVAYAVTDR